MIKRNDDKSAGSGSEKLVRAGTIPPRVARAKQLRKIREKSALAVPSAVTAADGTTRQPKQGRLRQLKATKQLATKLTAAQGVSERSGFTLAKPQQTRQLSAKKTFRLARTAAVVGGGPVGDKQQQQRVAQVRQLAAKKQFARKAETA
ncbi:hypothetical protein ACLEPN_19700 [Myxococcus sp. 1LA]